jgi:hypothetical protein
MDFKLTPINQTKNNGECVIIPLKKKITEISLYALLELQLLNY